MRSPDSLPALFQARLPMDMLSMKRYELPQPAAGKMTDVAAWQECVDNSQAQLEHQALRILNLEMMASYGVPAWKTYNDTLVSMIDSAQKQLQVREGGGGNFLDLEVDLQTI